MGYDQTHNLRLTFAVSSLAPTQNIACRSLQMSLHYRSYEERDAMQQDGATRQELLLATSVTYTQKISTRSSNQAIPESFS